MTHPQNTHAKSFQQKSDSLLRLTGAQSSIWFDQRIHPETLGYNIGFYIKFDGELDLDRLERATHYAMNSITSLRAEFFETDDIPFQRILKPQVFNIPRWDLSQSSDSQNAAQEIINADS